MAADRPSTRDVKLAYLIRAHHKPGQLARMIQRLRGDDIRFYLHVSARTPSETYEEMRSELERTPEVHWLPRVKAYYAGYSLVEAALVGLREIARERDPPDVTMLISGQDYPLRRPEAIGEFFAANRGRTVIEHYRLPTDEHWPDERGGLDRIERVHFERIPYRSSILRVPFIRRRFPVELTPYGGSTWFALSSDALRYLVAFERENPRVMRFFHRVLIPEEIFFQTVLVNSPLRETLVNRALHYTAWPGGSHPKTLGVEDFPTLAASDVLYARKFDVERDSLVLDAIDRELLGLPGTSIDE